MELYYRVLLTLLFVCVVALIVCLFMLLYYSLQIKYINLQLKRNKEVFNIMCKWRNTNDDRYMRYSYDDLYQPNRKNWYGLRMPKEEHYA